MNVSIHLYALSGGNGSGQGVNCDKYNEVCADSCGNDDGDDDCMKMCYEFYAYNDDDDDYANEDQGEDHHWNQNLSN